MHRSHLADRPPYVLLAVFTFLAWLAAAPCAAEDHGSIQGRVTELKTGHAVPFANVAVVEAKRGGLTDSEGHFLVGGLAPGTYEVRVQLLGFKPLSKTVVVAASATPLTQDFKLEELQVQQEKEVEVTGERSLVEIKQGATIRSTNAAAIKEMGVSTVNEVLQRQAGISSDAEQIHVRGGRSDETVFLVNGVANKDLVTGQSTAGELNARSVSEVNVATGAYDVRYGNALSGIVEIKLKEGTDKYQTGFTVTGGSYGARSWQLVSSGPDPIWTPALKAIGFPVRGTLTSILDVSGSLYDTRFSYLNDPTAGFFGTFMPSNLAPAIHSSYEDSFFGIKFKYPDFFSPSEDNRWAARYALDWKPNNRDKISLDLSKHIAIDQGFSRSFLTAQGDLGDPAFPWQWYHRLDHASTFFEDNVQTSLDWRRTLSTTGFLDAQVSRYFFAQRQDANGKSWQDYIEPDDRSYFPPGDPRRDDFFVDSGDYYQWSDRRTTSWGINGQYTQHMHHNEVEAGFEHQFQTVQYVDIEYPWIYDVSGLGQSHDLWLVHPWVGDVYGRDRLEYEGFIANLGVRADYWMVGPEAEAAIADTSRHTLPESEREDFYSSRISLFRRYMKVHISPRIIVSHPITQNSSFFFNYGHFTQLPSYRYVYSKLTSISSESFPLQGNPNLNPQVSVNYEVGAKDQFLPTAAANISFFVRDVYDYPNATLVQPLQGTNIQSYFIYLNGHFARSKGIEIEFEKRMTRYWAAHATYSYQQTKGKSGDPNQDTAIQELGGASAARLSQVFVSWNRPHKVTADLDFQIQDQAPARMSWAKHMGAHIYIQGESGRAYTPYDITNQNPIGLPYSQNAPFQVTTDFKVDRAFRFGGSHVDLSLIGNNIFSNHLIYRVDSVTGRGYVWGEGEFDPNYVHGLNDYVKTGTVDDPSNYGPGAEWRLQLDVDF